jgi:integrase
VLRRIIKTALFASNVRLGQSLLERGGAIGAKKMGRETSARQDQAHPLGWKDIKEFIESAGKGLRADRERALLCMAYETLARRSELVALEVRDLDLHPDGTGQALIRRGKTDAEGQGRMAYLSRETVRWLKVWLENAQIENGPIFRRLIGRAPGWRSIKFWKHRADLQAGSAMDRYAGTSGEPCERAFDARWRDPGFGYARYRSRGHYAGRWVEIDSDAAAICREDQCSKVRDGQGSGGRGA